MVKHQLVYKELGNSPMAYQPSILISLAKPDQFLKQVTN